MDLYQIFSSCSLCDIILNYKISAHLHNICMDGRGGSQVDRKATERVYAGGKDTERVEDGPDSADMEEERGCA